MKHWKEQRVLQIKRVLVDFKHFQRSIFKETLSDSYFLRKLLQGTNGIEFNIRNSLKLSQGHRKETSKAKGFGEENGRIEAFPTEV